MIHVRRLAGLLLGAAMVLTLARLDAQPSEPPPLGMSRAAEQYLTRALDLMATRAVDRHRVDWRALRPSLMQQAAGAQTPADTYPAIRSAVAALGNPHSRLLPPSPPDDSTGAAPVDVPKGRTLEPDLAYLSLPGVLGDDETATAYADAGTAVVRELDAVAPCGWVVDLREDHGGNMWPMLTVVAALLGSGTHGFFEDADGHRAGWGLAAGTPVLEGRVLFPTLRSDLRLRRADPPVAVLTGPLTASSGEAVLIAFRGRPATRTFGQPTAGLATANEAFVLPDGAMLLLTTANDVDRLGRVYDNHPIEPDTAVSDGSAPDPVLDAAAAWLRANEACRTAGG